MTTPRNERCLPALVARAQKSVPPSRCVQRSSDSEYLILRYFISDEDTILVIFNNECTSELHSPFECNFADILHTV